VTAPAFHDAIGPLCKHRKAQGMKVVVIKTTDVLSEREILAGDTAKLRDLVLKQCREGKGDRYLLLVGSIEAGPLTDPATKVLPPLKGTVSRMKGKLTDHGYGCPGTDHVPRVAVGRFPARTILEAQQMVARTIAYENNTQPGEWRRRVTVLAGAPGFGASVDKMVENMAFNRLGRLAPIWQGQAIFHNPSSRFNLPDEELHKRALAYVQAGQALTLYLGHSNALGFASGRAPYLTRDDWAKLAIRQGPGIFVTFGCYGCQIEGRGGQGYGLAAILNPRGPVAVIGSLGECFTTMALPAVESFTLSFGAAKPPARLAETWLALLRGIAREKTIDFFYRALDLADGDPRIPRATQRLEHLEMFILFGDPALRFPVVAEDIKLTCKDPVIAGKTITVQVVLPVRLAKSQVKLTLERPLNSKPLNLQPLPKEPAARARAILANHERANRYAVLTRDMTVKERTFTVQLKPAPNLPWPRLILRVYAHAEKAEGLGVLVVPVKESE
jgi:hypothetical protein